MNDKTPIRFAGQVFSVVHKTLANTEDQETTVVLKIPKRMFKESMDKLSDLMGKSVEFSAKEQ